MENEERTPFGRRLFDARSSAKITQEAAAKAVGMRSQSTLAEAELTGKRSGFTPQLAELYKVSAKWLATGKGERHLGYPTNHTNTAMAAKEPQPLSDLERELQTHLQAMSERGLILLVDEAAKIANRYPKDQAKAA
jgi:transcriptional regulator with XRE-family HTH domain